MPTVIKPKRSEVALSVPLPSSLEVGEMAVNVSDGKMYIKGSNNLIKEIGGAGSVTLQGATSAGNITTNDIILDGSNIVFEGLVANAFETTLSVVEPTQDRLINLPDVSGDVAVIQDGSYIVFEGSANDAFETTLSITNPTADRTITLPNQNGTIAMVDDALALSIVFGS
jgi:hypothetical protein